ncbi:MAG: zinc finger, CHC2-type [Aeromicrobium sp.]|nr:zinc finger, CHC2-type [Aeromicrobium sp.]
MRGRYDRDELLARTDLRLLLDELCGPPIALGRTARWRCPEPEHDDAHPSVTVTTDRRGIERWKCWSGGHGGTAIDAVHVAYRIGNREAFDELARRAGLQSDQPPVRPVSASPPQREPIALHPDAIRYVEACEQLLWKPIGRPVLEYLINRRGLDAEVLRVNRVGADPGSSRLRRGSGLPRGGPGAVFPAADGDGEIAYLQTRYIDPGEHRSKYGNPTSRLGDNPRHGWTRPAGAPKYPIVVCEGFPDAFTANGAGYSAVAVLGALNATPILGAALVPRIGSRPVIVAFDGDAAGRSASRILTESLSGHGIMVVELPLPSGSDLNSWVNAARQVPELGPSLRPTPKVDLATVPTLAISGP